MPKLKGISAKVKETYCAMFTTVGLKACIELASENAAFIRNSPLYKLVGNHKFIVAVKPGKKKKLTPRT